MPGAVAGLSLFYSSVCVSVCARVRVRVRVRVCSLNRLWSSLHATARLNLPKHCFYELSILLSNFSELLIFLEKKTEIF